MGIRGQDILVSLKLALNHGAVPPYARLAHELGISSTSQLHSAVQRAAQHGLLFAETRQARVGALLEFLIHGAKYCFPAGRGPFDSAQMVRGMPTAYSALPLRSLLHNPGPEIVWPDEAGTMRGERLEPIHEAAPTAARNDPRMHEVLALVDAFRVGRARERNIAATVLKEILVGA